MAKAKLTLIKGDKTDSKVDYRDALPVNMYAVDKPILGADGYMLNYPGIELFTTGNGLDRGGVYNDRFNKHFRLSGQYILDIDELGVTTFRGLILGADRASMPYSFNSQAIIANNQMYLYNLGDLYFTRITDPDIGAPIDGVWIDGYYFLTDGEYVYHTDADDETAIDPLKFATAEFLPDASLGVSKTQDNKVMVWGRHSVEYFVNASTPNFAFKRIESRAQKIGIVATHAKVECDGKFVIVGNRINENLSVYIVSIGSTVKIATKEIDKILSEYSDNDLQNISLEYRSDTNAKFIIIHLPDYVLCFNYTIAQVFDVSVAWSILKTGTADEPYRAINGIYDKRNAKWLYGDKLEAKIGYLDYDKSTHYGNIAEWLLYTPYYKLDGKSIDELEIETIPGYNSVDDAKVAISLAYDNPIYGSEYWMNYSEPLDYSQRFILRRLGNVNNYAGFRFRGASTSRMAFALVTITYG